MILLFGIPIAAMLLDGHLSALIDPQVWLFFISPILFFVFVVVFIWRKSAMAKGKIS